MRILNDSHLGVSRQSGTTPESRKALEDFQFDQLQELLHTEEDVLILGDLFHTHNVSYNIVWRTYDLLGNYLSNCNSGQLYLVAGNHDQSSTKGQRSSLDVLARLLALSYGDRFTYVTEPFDLTPEVRVIPNLPNNDIFDLEVERADKAGVHTLLLHCNYDNHFAVDADHSLNLTKEQAEKFGKIILAHEHTPRTVQLANTTVHVLGCQTPTSISDCKHTREFFYTKFNLLTGQLDRFMFMRAGKIYSEMNWQELDDSCPSSFIRITGDATAEQAGKATQAISKFRKKSDAFVISTAINIEGLSCQEDMDQATEEISNLNIVSMLFEHLKGWQVSAIKKMQIDEKVDLVEESHA
jgi:calcineurin-like phosphoesterase family protein